MSHSNHLNYSAESDLASLRLSVRSWRGDEVDMTDGCEICGSGWDTRKWGSLGQRTVHVCTAGECDTEWQEIAEQVPGAVAETSGEDDRADAATATILRFG